MNEELTKRLDSLKKEERIAWKNHIEFEESEKYKRVIDKHNALLTKWCNLNSRISAFEELEKNPI